MSLNSAAASAPRKNVPRNNQHNIPPRFNLPRQEVRSDISSPAVLQVVQPRLPVVPTSLQSTLSVSEYTLPAHGPIDLSQLTRPRSAMGLNGLLLDPEFASNRAYGPLSTDLRLPTHLGDLDSDWQAMHLTQDSSRSFMSGSRSLCLGEYGGSVRPSSSARSVSSLAFSRSPIVLDPPSLLSGTVSSQHSPLSSQSTPLHTPHSSHNPPQRMSALEIAQKFHQQQLLQKHHQSMLPTPPSSSSPLWSSGFSPYQDSLLSPEGLATTYWSNAPAIPARLTSQRNEVQLVSQTETTRGARYNSTEPSSNARNWSRGTTNWPNANHIQPPTLLGNRAHRTSDSVFSANAIDLSLLHRPGEATQQRRLPTVLETSQFVSPAQQSPSVPRPPPNTPMQSVKARQQVSKPELHSSPSPLSPTKSESGLRSLAQQHPRSVPLHRLIQRRLSSVPEEDYVLFVDKQKMALEDANKHSRFGSSKGNPHLQDLVDAPSAMHLKQKMRTPLMTSGSTRRSQEHSARPAACPSATPSVSDMKPQTRLSRMSTTHQSRTRDDSSKDQDGSKDSAARANRGRGRGRNYRRSRFPPTAVANGPERVDGGLTVRS